MRNLAAIPQRICSDFDLGEFASADRLGGTRNLNYAIVTSRGSWVARRRYAGYSDPERVRFDHAAIGFLAERGVPVAAPLRARSGATWLELDGGVWEVCAFVAGRHLVDGSVGDSQALGAALGTLHEAGHAFTGLCDKLGPRGETDPDRLVSDLSDGSDLSDALAPYEQAVRRAAEALTPEAFAALPHTLIHGDIQPANIIMGDGVVSAFVDFDWCAWRPRIYDLGFAAIACCSTHERPIGEGDIWDLTQQPLLAVDALAAFLQAYQTAGRPLSDAEKRALPVQTELTWLHSRIRGARKVPRSERVRFLQRSSELELAPLRVAAGL